MKRSMLLPIFIIAMSIISISIVVAKPIITEIMFNPQGSDSGNEWIEIYNQDYNLPNSSDPTGSACINLTKYRLFEDNISHKISSDSDGIFCEMAILASSRSNFVSRYNVSNDSDIKIFESSFSLHNSGEMIAVKFGEEYSDYIDYSQLLSYISVDDGKSLEYGNGAWAASENVGGNPGKYILEISNQPNNSSNLPSDSMPSNNTTPNATINETISMDENISQNISQNNTIPNDINQTINQTINDSVNSANASQKCFAKIEIIIKNETQIYANKQQIKFQSKISIINTSINTSVNASNPEASLFAGKMNYSIEYWIENVDSDMVKKKILTSNDGLKTFTPSIDSKYEIMLIKSRIAWIDSCNHSDEQASRMIIIYNKDYKEIPLKKEEKTRNATSCKCEPEVIITQCPAPLTKVVNVCNATWQSPSYGQSIEYQKAAEDINSSKYYQNEITGDFAYETTYESKNLKARKYAFLALGIIVIILVAALSYKSHHKHPKTSQKQV